MLDELKNKHVIFDKDNPESVEFRGEKYVRIVHHPFVRINTGVLEMVYAGSQSFPLLLLDDFGAYSTYCEEKEIIRVTNDSKTLVYAHENKVDEYRKVIEKDELSHLKFDYYEYDQELQKRVEKSYIIDESLMKIINEVPMKSEAHEINKNIITNYLELIPCDETNFIESEINGITIIEVKYGDSYRGFYLKKGTFKYDGKLEGIWVSIDDNNGFAQLMNNARNKGSENYREFYNYAN
jgi:hypothetical protein